LEVAHPLVSMGLRYGLFFAHLATEKLVKVIYMFQLPL